MNTPKNEAVAISIPASLVVALNLDNDSELWERHDVKIVDYVQRGRGRSAVVECPTREAVVVLIAELLYRWEERDAFDPEYRSESRYCGDVGVALAVKHEVVESEWPGYIWDAAKARVRRAREK